MTTGPLLLSNLPVRVAARASRAYVAAWSASLKQAFDVPDMMRAARADDVAGLEQWLDTKGDLAGEARVRAYLESGRVVLRAEGICARLGERLDPVWIGLTDGRVEAIGGGHGGT